MDVCTELHDLVMMRWRYRGVSVCANIRSQGKPMKFGEDRTMYAEDISDLCFSASSSESSKFEGLPRPHRSDFGKDSPNFLYPMAEE